MAKILISVVITGEFTPVNFARLVEFSIIHPCQCIIIACYDVNIEGNTLLLNDWRYLSSNPVISY